ncbi:MAG: hypothetical protein KIT87_08985 [Anaerolineae bacterium]|nr:hypothetical protein [Anaerolineae bacterium]
MRPSLRSLGCSAALALLALLGISLWVGMRVGMTAVWERGRAAQDSSAGLPGVAVVRHALWRTGHGVVADIESIEGQTLIVSDRQGEQHVIQVTSETRFLSTTTRPPARLGGGGLGELPELRPGARIIVLGQPRDDGVLEARLIRILPADAPSDSTRPPTDRRRRESP